MARKREEKAGQNSGNNAHKGQSDKNNLGKNKHYVSLKQQLLAMKLTLREIPGDGNCLFGALADQLDGTPKTHHKHRQDVVSYMRSHRKDFEPFVEDDIPFERHLSNLAELGTYGGNECIVAFARLNKVKVVIHQLNTPLWQIDGSEEKENIREIHISYHNGDHYNSVRRSGDFTGTPNNIKLTVQESNSNGEGNKKDESITYNKNENFRPSPLSYYHNDNNTCDQTYSENSVIACADEYNQIISMTGCDDEDVINKFLIANDHDIQSTVDDIINHLIIQSEGENSSRISPLWTPNGTGTRLFGSDALNIEINSQRDKRSPQEKIQERLKSSNHLSNTKRKELKKQLRKQQGNERKKQHDNQGYSDEYSGCENSDDSGGAIMVKDLGCLSI